MYIYNKLIPGVVGDIVFTLVDVSLVVSSSVAVSLVVAIVVLGASVLVDGSKTNTVVYFSF